MNSLTWIAQIFLAAVFLITGVGKLFAYRHLLGAVVARFKGFVAATTLALLSVVSGIFQISCRLSAAPAVALFLLALFVIFGCTV